MLAFFRCIRRLEEFLISFGILAIAGLTATNVVTRTGFGHSLAFAEELCQFLIVMITFVGASYAAGHGRHIRMTALYDQLSHDWKRRLMISSCVLTALLMFALTVFAVAYLNTLRALGTISPVLRVPLYLVYITAPLGLLMTGLQFCLTAFKNLGSPDKIYISYDVEDGADPL
ncbi:MAG: TRAP transporter small permease [Vulcanimicrobiota bacterium]